MTTPDRPISSDDLEVSLAVRRDLGPQHDAAVVGEFLDRVGAAIDERVDARLAAAKQLPGQRSDHRRPGPSPLAFASIGMGIPITAIALGTTSGGVDGIVALLIAWAGIIGVNLAYGRP